MARGSNTGLGDNFVSYPSRCCLAGRHTASVCHRRSGELGDANEDAVATQERFRFLRKSNNWELFSLRNGTMGLIWSSLCAELSCCLSLSHSHGECEWVAVGLLSECPRQCWPCARHTTRDRKATTLNCPGADALTPFPRGADRRTCHQGAASSQGLLTWAQGSGPRCQSWTLTPNPVPPHLLASRADDPVLIGQSECKPVAFLLVFSFCFLRKAFRERKYTFCMHQHPH